MTEKLKPCPFCGGEAAVVEIEPRLYRPVMNKPFCVLCTSCDLYFGYDYDYGGEFDTKEEAAAAWNRRAGDEGASKKEKDFGANEAPQEI
ncbi:MAG: Lar family restriction alleviation protein [Fretibacterium sp.]|nr:Lar family restriction alleviation protein [Fretibacterium sp.]